MEAGADMLGLMFVPSSKRYVSPEQARKISFAVHSRLLQTAEAAPQPVPVATEEMQNEPWFRAHARRLRAALGVRRPRVVGVFQDQPLDAILRAVEDAQLDMVQLHGREPVEWARHIPVPVIRVFHVDEEGHGLTDITRGGAHAFVLLDAVAKGSTAGLSGGSGTRVDLEIAKAVVEKGEVGGGDLPIILAGGLTPDSVREAVRTVRPWAVDVSGGVELKDGSAKDPARVQAFISAAKSL